MSNQELTHSEQEEIRRDKLTELNKLGVNPYPYSFDVTHSSKQILADESLIRDEESNPESEIVSVAGRVMTRRIMGKAAFFNLQDSKGTIQIYIRRDDVGVENYNTVFKKMVDIGDIVG
ncbi:MAG TPA: lysine--tRNA ligase, partial [Balneola sp.]|nr:lysine--tRNA ligase [Balneola sp.]